MSKKEEVSNPSAISKIKPRVLELSKKISEDLEVNKTDGVISEKESGKSYYGNLPENVTREQDEAIDNYRTEFIAATGLAIAEPVIATLNKNSGLDVVTAEIKMGKGTIRHAAHREKQYGYGSGADRKTIIKPGALITEVDIRGGSSTSGQLKVARDHLAELAVAKLTSKK